MTELLCKLFIKDHKNVKDPAVVRAHGTFSSVLGITVNVLLSAIKLLAGLICASVAITADALNNLSDAGSQIISLISFKMSSKPADKDHPFGHARIEYVASMLVSLMILSVSLDLFKSSLSKIFSPTETRFSLVAVLILCISIAAKLWLFFLNRHIGKKTDSSIIRATATDSLSDAAATSAVLISMLIARSTGFNADGYMGIAVSLLIFVAGIKILLEAKNLILGSPPNPEAVNGIKRITEEYPEILGIHDLVVHDYGAGNVIASLHAEVDGEANVFETHDVIDNIEKRLFAELGVSTTIHMDPIVTNDEETNEIKEQVYKKVKEFDPRLSIHDFRFVKGITHSNLIFDISVPYEIKLTNSEIIKNISENISEINPDYFSVITIDRQ